MSLESLNISDLLGGSFLLFALTSGLIEISPLKFNPWSCIARIIGRNVNGEVLAKVDKLEGDVHYLQTAFNERSAVDFRTRILRFGDEMLHGTKHTKDHFDQILDDVNRYELHCKKNPDFRNNMTHITVQQIKAEYARCLRENDFL